MYNPVLPLRLCLSDQAFRHSFPLVLWLYFAQAFLPLLLLCLIHLRRWLICPFEPSFGVWMDLSLLFLVINNNLNPVSRCVSLVQVWLMVRPASHFLPSRFRLVYWASPDRNVKVCWEWRLSRNTPNLYSCSVWACGLCVIHVCAHACLILMQLLHHIVVLHNAPMCVICVYEVLVISKNMWAPPAYCTHMHKCVSWYYVH